MNVQDLKDWILSLAQDIEFEYAGHHGVVSPWNKHSFTLCYNGASKDYNDIDKLMSDATFNGLSLNQIAGELRFVN